MRRNLAVVALLLTAVLAGCKTPSDSGGAATQPAGTTGGTGGGTSASTAPPAGPAPGVSQDAVKVGITYIDLSSIKEIANLDLGDYEKAYRAAIDPINAKGGIHGRRIEPTFAPVSPIGNTAADEACTKLTEDEQVFVAVGYFQADQVLCYVDTHETAVIGGTLTPERQAKAKAPWYSIEPSAGLEVDAIRLFAKNKQLDGKLGVVATIQNEKNMRATVLPLLDELGVPYVEVGVIDAPDNDAAAQNAAVASIAEKFKSEGVDKVLVTGEAGLPWANGVTSSDYRPKLVFTTVNSVRAYTDSNVPGRDFSMMNDAIAGGLYEAPSNQLPDDPTMRDCLAVQRAAGLTIVPPDEVPKGQPIQLAASSTACRNVGLLVALLTASGPDLNYGTFGQAGEKMGPMVVPGDPDAMHFGTGGAADGNPTAHVWVFDPTKQKFHVQS